MPISRANGAERNGYGDEDLAKPFFRQEKLHLAKIQARGPLRQGRDPDMKMPRSLSAFFARRTRETAPTDDGGRGRLRV